VRKTKQEYTQEKDLEIIRNYESGADASYLIGTTYHADALRSLLYPYCSENIKPMGAEALSALLYPLYLEGRVVLDKITSFEDHDTVSCVDSINWIRAECDRAEGMEWPVSVSVAHVEVVVRAWGERVGLIMENHRPAYVRDAITRVTERTISKVRNESVRRGGKDD